MILPFKLMCTYFCLHCTYIHRRSNLADLKCRTNYCNTTLLLLQILRRNPRYWPGFLEAPQPRLLCPHLSPIDYKNPRNLEERADEVTGRRRSGPHAKSRPQLRLPQNLEDPQCDSVVRCGYSGLFSNALTTGLSLHWSTSLKHSYSKKTSGTKP